MNSQFLKHDSPGLDAPDWWDRRQQRPKAFFGLTKYKTASSAAGDFVYTCLHAASSLEIENWQPAYIRIILSHSNIFCQPQEVIMFCFLLWFNTNKSVMLILYGLIYELWSENNVSICPSNYSNFHYFASQWKLLLKGESFESKYFLPRVTMQVGSSVNITSNSLPLFMFKLF